jgi:hypothetical protein
MMNKTILTFDNGFPSIAIFVRIAARDPVFFLGFMPFGSEEIYEIIDVRIHCAFPITMFKLIRVRRQFADFSPYKKRENG